MKTLFDFYSIKGDFSEVLSGYFTIKLLNTTVTKLIFFIEENYLILINKLNLFYLEYIIIIKTKHN